MKEISEMLKLNTLTGGACAALLVAFATSGCQVRLNAGPVEEPPQPAPAPAPAPKAKKPKMKFAKFNFKMEGNRLVLPASIFFETAKPALKPESDVALEHVLKYLKGKKHVTKMRIEGHTDTDGQDDANMVLSKLRAMAVAKWLTAKGIDCKRLVPVGFGETKLKKSPEETAQDKEENRRVDFVNAELKGKAIGGLPLDGGGEAAGNACE